MTSPELIGTLASLALKRTGLFSNIDTNSNLINPDLDLCLIQFMLQKETKVHWSSVLQYKGTEKYFSSTMLSLFKGEQNLEWGTFMNMAGNAPCGSCRRMFIWITPPFDNLRLVLWKLNQYFWQMQSHPNTSKLLFKEFLINRLKGFLFILIFLIVIASKTIFVFSSMISSSWRCMMRNTPGGVLSATTKLSIPHIPKRDTVKIGKKIYTIEDSASLIWIHPSYSSTTSKLTGASRLTLWSGSENKICSCSFCWLSTRTSMTTSFSMLWAWLAAFEP